MDNENTIQFIRGDTYAIQLTVKDANGDPYVPMPNDILTMTVREKDYRGLIVIQKISGDNDVIVIDGGWQITIQPNDTSELEYKSCVYDIELNMSGIIQTVIPLSKFILDKEVTY